MSKTLKGCIDECEYYYEFYQDDIEWNNCIGDCNEQDYLGYFDEEYEREPIAERNYSTEATAM